MIATEETLRKLNALQEQDFKIVVSLIDRLSMMDSVKNNNDSIIAAKDIYGKWEMYSDIELSEQQIKEGKTKNAKAALSAVKEKYGL